MGFGIFFPTILHAQRITLEALQRDGYGVVQLKRPQPNVLIALTEIDGRKFNLIVDTGWGAEGITVQSDYRGSAPAGSEELKNFGRSASGAELKNVKKSTAAKVVLGNVQMAQVPIFYGNFKGLLRAEMQRRVRADGFLGAGFLRTCSAIVDLHNLRLYLRPPGVGRRAMIGPALKASGLAEASFQQAGGHDCLIDVEINGHSGKMLLDTGAYFTGIDERLGTKLKASFYKSRVGMIDAAGVARATKVMQVKSFLIDGVPARVRDVRLNRYGFYGPSNGALIGLLGMDVLGPNGTIIDFGQRKLYFYKAE